SKNCTIGVEFVMGADSFFNRKNKLLNFLNRLVDKEAQRLCIRANGVSYVTEDILQSKYPSHSIKYIETKNHFHTNYSTIDLHDEHYYNKNWKLHDEPKVFNITHIGYMDSDRKGHEILIRAIQEVIKEGYHVKMTFIGDGLLMPIFKKLASDLNLSSSIIFYGATNNSYEITQILKDSHSFVLPSKSEGLPRAIIEAMATGNPC